MRAVRAGDPLAGRYEAGAVQWWWKDEGVPGRSRHTFRLNAVDRPIAALLLAKQGPRQPEPGRIDADLFWRPSADAAVRAVVLPVAVGRLTDLRAAPDCTVGIYADERDGGLRRRLERVGFRRDPDGDIVQMWQRPAALPSLLPLPARIGFADDRSRLADRPHHLVARNGEDVADRLQECSVYRPDLDLSVYRETDEVAAYGVC